MSCRRCEQPGGNCGRSDRRAMSCDIRVIPIVLRNVQYGFPIFFSSTCQCGTYFHCACIDYLVVGWAALFMLLLQIIPCYIEEKIKELGDKWLVAKTSHGHLFDFSIVKRERRTYLCGPFQKSYLAYHDIVVGDVVRLECLEADEIDAENPQNAPPPKVFVTVSDSAGNNNPYIPLAGMVIFLVRFILMLFILFITCFCVLFLIIKVRLLQGILYAKFHLV